MGTLRLLAVSALLFACSEDTEEKENSFLDDDTFESVESDIIGDWMPVEEQQLIADLDGDVVEYYGIHLIVDDSLEGTFEFQRNYTYSGSDDVDDSFMVMADISAEFDGQYFTISFENAVKTDILTDEESSYQLNSILCTSEENLGSTKPDLSCEPKFAGTDIGSTILFEK
jgi:hypothetical protein